MNKKILVTGAIFGITGVILGAFAAHGLQKIVDAEAIKSFEISSVLQKNLNDFIRLLVF